MIGSNSTLQRALAVQLINLPLMSEGSEHNRSFLQQGIENRQQHRAYGNKATQPSDGRAPPQIKNRTSNKNQPQQLNAAADKHQFAKVVYSFVRQDRP
jgi:hypothetical protein